MIAPGDPVLALKQTTQGQPNVLADPVADTDPRGASLAINGNLAGKYFNHGQDADGSILGAITPASSSRQAGIPMRNIRCFFEPPKPSNAPNRSARFP